MPDRAVMVSLAAPGVEPTRVGGRFTDFTRGTRMRRSAVVLLVAFLLAAMFIPIPIIHLLAIPLLLITGFVAAVRQLRMIGRLQPVRIACPKCGASNRVGGGLGYRSLDPMDRNCESCRRALTLRIEPVEGGGGGGG